MFKAKGQSEKHLCPPIYGYKKSDTDKNLWVIDDTAAEVIRRKSAKTNADFKEKLNLFSGMVCCADCGAKIYLSRRVNEHPEQKQLKSTVAELTPEIMYELI